MPLFQYERVEIHQLEKEVQNECLSNGDLECSNLHRIESDRRRIGCILL